jgi:pyridoxal phosphate enzyme (YggS family)
MFSPTVYSEIAAHLPASVKLIAVTKTKAIADIEAAYAAGIRDFAESRVQEALPKIEALADLTDIRWHFIGRLQANKARKVVENFAWIHSVDHLSVAQRLDRLAQELALAPNVLLQVKMLPDEGKTGWTPDQLRQELPEIEPLKALKIRGLMTILPLGLTPSERQATFQNVADFAHSLNQELGLNLSELSMGMSQDYPQAIAAGATLIRLGTILFGDRV